MHNRGHFSYDNYSVQDDRRSIDFAYSLSNGDQLLHLSERLRFPEPLHEGYETEMALRGLHIALGISYYKAFVPPEIKLPYKMDQNEANFWNEVWENGLAEFLYVNQLSTDRLAKFRPQEGIEFDGEKHNDWQDSALLGIGGGKDSIVAGELLKQVGVETVGFVMAAGEQRGQTQDVAKTMGIDLKVIEREIDPQLLELNKQPDTYNGHVPISLILAFAGTLTALSLRSRYITVANEASASIPRIHTNDLEVNHQWSKSHVFEQMFQKYLTRYISDDLNYFSIIRPLNSVAVAKLFAQYPQYNEVFTSDNSVFRLAPEQRPAKRWSLESPKSLSSFILMAPWMDEGSLQKAFERNFLDERELEGLFLALIGEAGDPPLDCVGTTEELRASLSTVIQQGKFTDSHLVGIAKHKGLASEGGVEQFIHLEKEDSMPTKLRPQLLHAMEKGLGL